MMKEKSFVKTETKLIPVKIVHRSNLSFVLFIELSNQIILTYCYKCVHLILPPIVVYIND